jgi:hypothetical protein
VLTGFVLLLAGFLSGYTIALVWWEGLTRTISTGSVLRDISAIAAAVAAMSVGDVLYRFAASLRAYAKAVDTRRVDADGEGPSTAGPISPLVC